MMINQNLLLTGDDGYNLTKSLRFRSSASAYLSRTPASAGNNQTWTWSGWIKLGTLDVARDIFSCGANTSNWTGVDLRADGRVQLFTISSGVVVGSIVWSPNVYRDPSAWYHFTIVCDTTNATQTSRFRFYVNGVQVTGISSTGGENTWPSQNANTNVNTTVAHSIGRKNHSANEYFDGYLTEVNFIDGQSLTPSSFGETDVLTGVWKPKKYAGTYGTNGFYLPFTDVATTSGSNAGLGKDFSGNGNYWNTNNISVTSGSTYDPMLDSPSNASSTIANYCTLNPLANPNGPLTTYSNGNLAWSNPSSAGNAVKMTVLGTIGIVSSGSFYFEHTVGASTNQRVGYSSQIYSGGVARGDVFFYYGSSGASTGSTGIAVVGTPASLATGDVVGVAYDVATGTATFYKNGTSQCTLSGIPNTTVLFPYAEPETGGATSSGSFNFGQQPFVYTPPTGFNRLNTYNLPVPTIPAGNKVMDATLYTGNGGTQSVVNTAGFYPDLVWAKSRSNAVNHNLYDSVRGVQKLLSSSLTDAEYNATTGLTSFNSNGFTSGSDSWLNASGQTYVGWQWQAGQGVTSSNTNGTITSTVSVNQAAGFSVVTYTGSGAAGTVGHGLGVAPAMIITKNRTTAGNSWVTWQKAMPSAYSSTTAYMYLDQTAAAGTTTNFYDGTAMTSSTFRWQTGNININSTSNDYVSYCWAEVAGFSAFGSYTGNGSADGSFVYTGFRPRFVMFKRTDSAGYNWYILDTARNTYNEVGEELSPNLSDAAYSQTDMDILSNGFKLRTSAARANASGGTYIYMAFAENPTKYALGR